MKRHSLSTKTFDEVNRHKSFHEIQSQEFFARKIYLFALRLFAFKVQIEEYKFYPVLILNALISWICVKESRKAMSAIKKLKNL